MTVIQFPVKKKIELSKKHEKRIEKFAKGYVSLLADVCNDLDVANSTAEEYEEILNLVLTKLLESLNAALEEELIET